MRYHIARTPENAATKSASDHHLGSAENFEHALDEHANGLRCLKMSASKLDDLWGLDIFFQDGIVAARDDFGQLRRQHYPLLLIRCWEHRVVGVVRGRPVNTCCTIVIARSGW